MKPLEDFLTEKREITIHTLASYVRQYIREQWQVVLQEQQEELLHLFDKAGEVAYGVYGRTLFQPIQEQLTCAGFLCEPGFPGDFRSTSIEYWGPPEERERCLWCTVSTAQGTSLGTLVTRIFHDHTQFRIPYAPAVLTLEETEPQAIINALAHASVRLQGTERREVEFQSTASRHVQSGWEYSVEVGLADYLDPKHLEISEGMLDGALSLWRRYGWELVTVIPYQERMIAFFKRPIKANA